MPTTFPTAYTSELNVFHREAGDPAASKLMLLGGFPSSSHQFRNLMAAQQDDLHLVSFDHPGFGSTDTPDPAKGEYTFGHLAGTVNGALQIGFTGPMGGSGTITAPKWRWLS